MEWAQALQTAITAVDSALATLKQKHVATQKAASLVNAGVVNPVEQDKYANLFKNYSPESMELATPTLLNHTQKEANWGSVYEPTSTGGYTVDSLDAFLLAE